MLIASESSVTERPSASPVAGQCGSGTVEEVGGGTAIVPVGTQSIGSPAQLFLDLVPLDRDRRSVEPDLRTVIQCVGAVRHRRRQLHEAGRDQ
nr:hypothetical protein [Rhodococcus erythropolis]